MACGASIDLICQDQGECLGWNDAQIEQCQSEGAALQDLADAADCNDENEEWADCVLDNSRCENNKYIFADACEEFSKQVLMCMKQE